MIYMKLVLFLKFVEFVNKFCNYLFFVGKKI